MCDNIVSHILLVIAAVDDDSDDDDDDDDKNVDNVDDDTKIFPPTNYTEASSSRRPCDNIVSHIAAALCGCQTITLRCQKSRNNPIVK